MDVVRCGLASVLPLQLLSLLTAEDLSLRMCGLPTIDLAYLKVVQLLLNTEILLCTASTL